VADALTPGESPSPSTETCPKCGKKRATDSTACPRCGLVFALWSPDSVPSSTVLDQRGISLWEGIQANWGDSARHEEFLRHCLQTDKLAAAGRLYRERLDATPNDVIAAQMQKEILSKATLGLSLHKTPPREPITRTKWFWTVVLTAMALGIAGGLFWRRFR
jgi:hypothetical protein